MSGFGSVVRLRYSPGRVVRLVASNDLEYGMSRVFSAFEEKCGDMTNVFRTRPDAVAWLRAPGPEDG